MDRSSMTQKNNQENSDFSIGSLIESFSLGKVEHYVDELKDYASEAMETSVDFAKRHPLYTIIGAAAIAFAAGSMISKTITK